MAWNNTARSERRANPTHAIHSSRPNRPTMSASSTPTAPRLTDLEKSNVQYDASTTISRDERRTRKRAKARLANSVSRSQRSRMSASSVPISRAPRAPEAFIEQCDTHIRCNDRETARTIQPDCPICCTEFDNNQNSQHTPYSCPNDACTVNFCEKCKENTLEHDYRCPFCRCELDGATLAKSTWNNDEMDEADILAAATDNMDELFLGLEADIILDLIRDNVISAAPSPTLSTNSLPEFVEQAIGDVYPPPLSPSRWPILV